MGRILRSLTIALLVAAGAIRADATPRDIPAEILDVAISAYKAGSYEPAIGGINAAMRSGLAGKHMARALYYRGLSYRKQGQPGHAISDLTRALDYDGLTPSERSDAMEARSAAYQEAGIADQETVIVTGKGAGATHAQEARRPAVTPSPATGSTSPAPPAEKPAGKWAGGTHVAVAAPLPLVTTTFPPPSDPAPAKSAAEPKAATPKPSPEAKLPPPAKAMSSSKPAPTPAAETRAAAAVKPAPPSKEVTAAPPAKASKAAPPQPASWPAPNVTAAKLPPDAPKPVSAQALPTPIDKAPADKAKPEAKRKSLAAQSAEPQAPFVTKVAMLAPAELPPPISIATAPLPPAVSEATPPAAPAATPAAAPAAATTAAPEFRLLVGETRTRNEAFALAVRLTSQRGPSLGPRKPQIAAGTMADVAVYRVRLGPFADAGQAQSVCQSLRDSGYACIFE